MDQQELDHLGVVVSKDRAESCDKLDLELCIAKRGRSLRQCCSHDGFDDWRLFLASFAGHEPENRAADHFYHHRHGQRAVPSLSAQSMFGISCKTSLENK